MSVRLDLMASTKPLITVVMDDEQLRRLDDWRFAKHFSSRGAAIRWMVEYCLKVDATPADEEVRPPRRNKVER